jgi:RNA polymerase sigma-70 factor (ECF subfamily)
LPADVACALPNPEAAWGRTLTARALSHCLQTLPEEQREVFLLREEAELSLQVIAEITGSGLEAAKSRLRYALKKLRQCLEAVI